MARLTAPLTDSEVPASIARDQELIDALTGKVSKAANLSDLQDVGEARGNLGLGTAAVEGVEAFDAAGTAGTVQDSLIAHEANTDNPHVVTAEQVSTAAVDGREPVADSAAITWFPPYRINVARAPYKAANAGTTDSTSAILEANADAAVAGAELYLPAGAGFRMSSPLPFETSGRALVGDGIVSRLSNATTDVFTLGTSSTHLENAKIADLRISSLIGGGHVFSVPHGTAMSAFERLLVIQQNAAKSLWRHVRAVDGGGMYNNLFQGGEWRHTLGATVPGFHIRAEGTNGGNICSDNVWADFRARYAGSYFFDFDNSTAGRGMYNNTIRNLEGEVIYGGIVRLRSVMGFVVDSVRSYDTPNTVDKTLFLVEKGAAGPRNQGVEIRRCGRQSGTLAPGMYDIHFSGDNTSTGARIDEYITLPAASAQIDLGTNNGVVLLGNFDDTTITGFDPLLHARISASGIQAPNIGSDSGWVLPTLATDVTVNGTAGAHLGYRKIGKVVYLQISVDVASPASDKLLFTLPAGYRPEGSVRVVALGASGAMRVYPTNGEVRMGSATSPVAIAMSYPVAAI